MRFGENIQRLGAWALVFVVAQGMVYRWGYDQGYFRGTRQGYCDFFEEKASQRHSAEAFRADAAAVAGSDGQTPNGDTLLTTP